MMSIMIKAYFSRISWKVENTEFITKTPIVEYKAIDNRDLKQVNFGFKVNIMVFHKGTGQKLVD